MRPKYKILFSILVFLIFVVVPLTGIGAVWVQHVGLLPGTAVVFPSDAATMDRFMAAALKPYYGDRVGICDGTNDHVEVQAALDAVDEVLLSVGTFNCEVSVTIDSYQTFRGCGRNTILTTTTADLDIITATGGSGTEKVGILIADLCIDGDAGFVTNDMGILWTYIDYSVIRNIWSIDNGEDGISLVTCDNNIILGNICSGNDNAGVYLETCSYNTITNNNWSNHSIAGIYIYDSSHNTIVGNTSQADYEGIYIFESSYITITGNTCFDNGENCMWIEDSSDNTISGNTCSTGVEGIYLDGSSANTVTGNTCQGNYRGIHLFNSSKNTVIGNTCQVNDEMGIWIEVTSHSTVMGNILTENSQDTTNTYDDIFIENNSDYNNIQGNTCRAGLEANKPRYGINIATANSDKNIVDGNDIYDDGFGTAPFNDTGTLTIVKSSNRGIQITDVKDYIYIKNTSGAQRVTGDVVRHKAVAVGNEFDMPTANGEDSVLGMVAETINNNAYGYVQVLGMTTVLKATNAGGNIAIGDYLCTENGVRARLAGAGDMAFARALEACAAADCTIDALIISPMKI